MNQVTRTLSLIGAGAAATWGAYQYEPTRETLESVRVVQVRHDPIEERVIELPEDGSAWHVSVFVNVDETGRDKEVKVWFRTDSRLASLAAQTHYHEVDSGTQSYRHQWAQHVGTNLPAVVVQQADGKVVYKASGDNLPRSSRTLANEIADCCPRPKPTPIPVTPPKPDVPDIRPVPDVDVDVDVNNEPEEPEGLPGWLIAILAALGIGGGSGISAIRQERM